MLNRHRPHEDPEGERTEFRRDEDVVAADIVERVIGEPASRSLVSTGKIIAAVMIIGTFGASVMGAVGGRYVTSRQETARLDARIDTVAMRAAAEERMLQVRVARADSILAAMREDTEMSSFVNCLLVRRLAPDLRPKGCDAAEQRARVTK